MSDATAAQQKCERMKNAALNSSARVKFMLRALSNAGCPIVAASFVECDVCEHKISGAMYEAPAFVAKDGVTAAEHPSYGIIMCNNNLSGKTQDYFDTVVTHELIHTFDVCRAITDFTSLDHHACTEIRAANLSGECTFTRELKRGTLRISNHHRNCVKRRAVVSVLSNPNVETPDDSKQAVERVFERCYKDVQPFGSIPW